MVTPFVAVHIGAGHHPSNYEAELKKLCDSASLMAIKLLRDGSSAVDAAELAVTILEDHPMTNAGFGSNLNYDGIVECDAAIIDGSSGLFGCVGAVPTRRILEGQKNCVKPKLVPPTILVGHGALKKANNENLITFDHWDPLSGPMVSEYAVERYHRHQTILKELCGRLDDNMQDTVGAIAIDQMGFMAVAVSSGGISLKQSGRVGDSAIPGCGVWIKKDQQQPKPYKVGCCTTGTGEQLIKTDFARSLSTRLYDNINSDHGDIISQFLTQFCSLDFETSPAAGFISLMLEGDDLCEFWYGFTTESMGIGYMSATDETPHSIIDRLRPNYPYRISGKLVSHQGTGK